MPRPSAEIQHPAAAWFRFHGSTRDFLPRRHQDRWLRRAFTPSPAVKDPIEAIGVPHPEVEAVQANGISVDLHYRLRDQDRIDVYSDAPANCQPLRPAPSRPGAFVLDVNLGALARRLRLCGFDSLYRNDFTDHQVAKLATAEQRIVLTRDRRLLHHRTIVHGYWVRATDPDAQLEEVMSRFCLLDRLRPYRRCVLCNGAIERVPKQAVMHELEPMTRRYYNDFFRCADCGKVYWRGSHVARSQRRLQALLGVGTTMRAIDRDHASGKKSGAEGR